jgi:DNA-binding NtrC family response regulator
LENVLERGLILAGEGEIAPDQLGGRVVGAKGTGLADLLVEGFELDAFESQLIYGAIEKAGGNKPPAARLLGITRRRLYSMLASLSEPGQGERD